MFAGKLDQPAGAAGTNIGLQRVAAIIDSAVQHPAITATGVRTDATLLVQNGDTRRWAAEPEFARDCQSDNTRANDNEVVDSC